MKKLLMSLALVGTFAAMSAKGADSYMYWMVSGAQYGDTGVYAQFVAADLYAVADGSKTLIGSWATEGGPVSSTDKNVATWAVDGDMSGYSFLVELWNETSKLTEGTLGYVDVKNAIYTSLNPSGAGVATFTSFNVPEPTSGLLMLIGLCGLALKRKRA